MSYAQAMKWSGKHPKGTKQTIIMSTGSGFWPAYSWLTDTYGPYCEACKEAGLEPWDAERFYRRTIRKDHIQRSPTGYVAMMLANTL